MTLEGALTLLEEAWPQRFTPEQAGVYLDALEDLDPDDVRAAVLRLVRTEEFRPSVARIRREVAAGSLPSIDVALRQAETLLGYREARQFVNGSGFDPVQPDVDDAVIAACAGLRLSFGWRDRFTQAWREQMRRAAGE